jgi:hypothetical protein
MRWAGNVARGREVTQSVRREDQAASLLLFLAAESAVTRQRVAKFERHRPAEAATQLTDDLGEKPPRCAAVVDVARAIADAQDLT